MANWQRRLDIASLWQKTKRGKASLRDLARHIAEKLRKLKNFGIQEIDIEKKEIISNFESFADSEYHPVDVFDDIMGQLYHWSEIKLDSAWPPKKVCWIETFNQKYVEEVWKKENETKRL